MQPVVNVTSPILRDIGDFLLRSLQRWRQILEPTEKQAYFEELKSRAFTKVCQQLEKSVLPELHSQDAPYDQSLHPWHGYEESLVLLPGQE